MPSFGSQNNGQAPSASGPAYATSPPTLSRNGSFANITTQNGTMTSTFLTGQQPIRPPGAIGSAFPLPIGSGLSPNGFPKEPTSTGSNSLTAQSSSATTPYYTILIRRLSLDTTEQTICLILSFAKDCVGIDLLPPENSDDPGFLSANVRFASPNGAFEAQKNLHGKKNLKQDATMIVEVVNGARRGTVDMSANATPSSSLSSSRGSGRMAVPFQPFEGVGSSSAGGFFNTNNGAGRFGASDLTNNSEPVGPANQYQLYPNHSPIGVPRARPANRELLEDDAVFPSDPLTMRPPIYNDNMNNNNNSLNAAIREAGLTGPDSDSLAANLESQPFFKRFGSLSLNTEDVVNDSVHGPFTAAPRGAHGAPMSASMGAPGSMSAPMSASASNVRSASMVNSMNSTLNSAMTSPYASFSNTPMPTQPHMMNPLALEVNGYGQAITFPPTSQYQPTHKMPPINLADQNPPCNTLYVGNLPPGAAEEELKAMFSRQRGYKRMCFRTKPNGPMCFVEFENITSATKALLDLYGKPLHNSIKGGIRLSFSKNPLGVRSNQNPHIPMPLAKTNPSHTSIGSFPPPGLAVPSGLGNGNVGGGNMAPAHHGNSMQHPAYLDYSGWAPTNASQYHLGATNGDRNGAHPSKQGPSLGGGQGFNPGRF